MDPAHLDITIIESKSETLDKAQRIYGACGVIFNPAAYALIRQVTVGSDLSAVTSKSPFAFQNDEPPRLARQDKTKPNTFRSPCPITDPFRFEIQRRTHSCETPPNGRSRCHVEVIEKWVSGDIDGSRPPAPPAVQVAGFSSRPDLSQWTKTASDKPNSALSRPSSQRSRSPTSETLSVSPSRCR